MRTREGEGGREKEGRRRREIEGEEGRRRRKGERGWKDVCVCACVHASVFRVTTRWMYGTWSWSRLDPSSALSRHTPSRPSK